MGQLIEIDARLLVFRGKTGELAMVQMTPEKYEELGSFTPLGGQSYTAPIICNGRLIVRNRDALACFKL